jgi:hypothetical protein
MLDELIAASDKEVGEYKAAAEEVAAKKNAKDTAQGELDAAIGVAETQRGEATQALQTLIDALSVPNF